MAKRTSGLDLVELSDLIGEIYDCVIDPTRWNPTLDRLRELLDCISCGLGVMDMRNVTARMQMLVGVEPEWVARMPKYAADVADMFSSLPDLMTRPIDEPFVARRDLSEKLLSNPYWEEWARPQGQIDVISLHLMRDPGRFAAISFGRHRDVGPITGREVRLLRLLAPHLRRAVTISDLIDMRCIEAQTLSRTLDQVPAGVVLVAEDAEILYANRIAHRMMDEGAPIRAAAGKLSVLDTEAEARLSGIVGAAARNEAGIGAAGLGMALTGPEGPRATAHVLPIAAGALRSRLMPRGAAAVFIASQRIRLRLDLAPVADAYGLTHAETRMLERLMRGESLLEAAAVLGISHNTARTHLSRLFAKTGTQRQAALVALIGRLIAHVAPAEGADE